LFLKVNTKTVNNAISFGEGVKVAPIKGTTKDLGIIRAQLRVFGADMEVQCLFLKKPLFAGFTDVISFFYVFFHMIMHGILSLHDNVAFRAYKVSVCIFDIGERHGGRGMVRRALRGFNF